MKIDLPKKTLVILSFILTIQSTAQDVVDYVSWSPSSPPCNLFFTSTNVPTTSGLDPTLAHTSSIGQPQWNNTNSSIEMKSEVVSGVYYGTQYAIAYNFKAGGKYYITINAAVQYTSGVSSFPLLITDLVNSPGSSTGCSGTGMVGSVSVGGNKLPAGVVSASFNNYAFNYSTQLASSQSYLTITAAPSSTSAITNTIYIRSVTITETPPPFTFPTTLSLPCGSTATQSFTVGNPWSIPNVTSYEWDLGSYSNGWKYGGVTAGRYISTSTPTLYLDPDCTTTQSNVAVTVKVNSVNYDTYTCVVSNTTPTMSISGASLLCSSGSYSIANLPCAATVTWTTDSHITYSSTTSTTPTVYYAADGYIPLTATVDNVCGVNGIVVSKNVTIGAGNPPISVFKNYDANCGTFLQAWCSYDSYETTGFTYYLTDGSTVYYSGTEYISGSHSGQLVLSPFLTTPPTSTLTLYLTAYAVNGCGTSAPNSTVAVYNIGPSDGNCGGGGGPINSIKDKPTTGRTTADGEYKLSVFPNPVKDILTVTIPDSINITHCALVVHDANGKQVLLVPKVSHFNKIQVSKLIPGIYFVQLYDGKKRWLNQKIIKR